MKNVTHYTGLFEILRAEKSSLNGNPRYLCRLDGWTCYTAPDSALGYAAPGFDGKRVSADLGSLRGRCTVENAQLV